MNKFRCQLKSRLKFFRLIKVEFSHFQGFLSQWLSLFCLKKKRFFAAKSYVQFVHQLNLIRIALAPFMKQFLTFLSFFYWNIDYNNFRLLCWWSEFFFLIFNFGVLICGCLLFIRRTNLILRKNRENSYHLCKIICVINCKMTHCLDGPYGKSKNISRLIWLLTIARVDFLRICNTIFETNLKYIFKKIHFLYLKHLIVLLMYINISD